MSDDVREQAKRRLLRELARAGVKHADDPQAPRRKTDLGEYIDRAVEDIRRVAEKAAAEPAPRPTPYTGEQLGELDDWFYKLQGAVGAVRDREDPAVARLGALVDELRDIIGSREPTATGKPNSPADRLAMIVIGMAKALSPVPDLEAKSFVRDVYIASGGHLPPSTFSAAIRRAKEFYEAEGGDRMPAPTRQAVDTLVRDPDASFGETLSSVGQSGRPSTTFVTLKKRIEGRRDEQPRADPKGPQKAQQSQIRRPTIIKVDR